MWLRATSSTAGWRRLLRRHPRRPRCWCSWTAPRSCWRASPADGEHFDDFLDDSIQAISYQGAGADNAQLDVVLFANTLTNKTNQRDEYNFISNAAWAAVLNDTGYSDVAPNAW